MRAVNLSLIKRETLANSIQEMRKSVFHVNENEAALNINITNNFVYNQNKRVLCVLYTHIYNG